MYVGHWESSVFFLYEEEYQGIETMDGKVDHSIDSERRRTYFNALLHGTAVATKVGPKFSSKELGNFYSTAHWWSQKASHADFSYRFERATIRK